MHHPTIGDPGFVIRPCVVSVFATVFFVVFSFRFTVCFRYWFHSRSPRCVSAELPSGSRTASPPEMFLEGGAVCLTPNGGKPPLLLETEMTKTPKAFSEAAVGDRKPVAT